jgi:hypothetical protein
LWRPTDKDITLLTNWLTSRALSTLQNQVAQAVLGLLNWNCEDSLPWRHHQTVALAVTGAGLKHAPDSIAGGFLEESVKQVSNIANVVRESPEQVYTRWAWKTVSKLKLHACDMEEEFCVGAVKGGCFLFYIILYCYFIWKAFCFVGSPAAFKRMLDFDLSPRVEDLVKGVCAKNPLACCVALQTTQIGHIIPEICNRGLGHLRTLAFSGRFDHVMECLLSITPLFLDTTEALVGNAHFMSVIQGVVSADQTYFKMAKDLIISDFPGPVTEEFSFMLHKQLCLFKKYGLRDETKIVMLWLNVMTAMPNWHKDKNIIFVVNLLCRVGFYKTEVGTNVKDYLVDMNKVGFLV